MTRMSQILTQTSKKQSHLDAMAAFGSWNRPPLVTLIDEPPTPMTIGAQHLCRPVPSTSTRNAFQALADDHHELDDETITTLNGWATCVHRKTARNAKAVVAPRSPDIFDQFTMRSENGLNVLLRKHPRLAAIPDTDKKIRKALRSKPVELECSAGEFLRLVDSGSTINAAWIGKHVPQYVDVAVPTPASERGDFTTTAGGDTLFNKGRCLIKGQVQDQSIPVESKDMEVELTIVSVK